MCVCVCVHNCDIYNMHRNMHDVKNEKNTLIFIMIDFFFLLQKKTRVSIPDPKCTCSSSVLSVSVRKSTNRVFLSLKKKQSL